MFTFVHGVLPHRISNTNRSLRCTRRRVWTCSTATPSQVDTKPELNNAAGLRTCEEITEDIQLKVRGKIPSYVSGRLYRNGPGLFQVTHKDGSVSEFKHWFDGIGVVHRFYIDSSTGTVLYKNRRVNKEYIEAAENASSKQDYKATTFGAQDPCRSVLGSLFQYWKPFTKHPVTKEIPYNISVTLERLPNAGSLVSRSDMNYSAVLDIDTLDVARKLTFSDFNPGLSGIASAAHGVIDPDSGSYLNYTHEYGPNQEYVVFETKEDETRILAKIKERSVYVHSFAVTKKYVVFMFYSAPINFLELLKDPTTFATAIDQNSKLRVKFYVISRADAKVTAVYDADPFFCFHNINAYDKDDQVVIDLVKYEDASVIDKLYLDEMMNAKSTLKSTPVRFTIDNIKEAAAAYKNDGKPVARLVPKPLTQNADIELPRIPDSLITRPYRYAYGVSNTGIPAPAPLFNSLVKLDTENGEVVYYTPRDGACGEPIFVADPLGTGEDDGVLLSVVLDKAEEKSFMVIVDARTMKEVARATVPQAVPFGFHGQFMSEELAQRIV